MCRELGVLVGVYLSDWLLSASDALPGDDETTLTEDKAQSLVITAGVHGED